MTYRMPSIGFSRSALTTGRLTRLAWLPVPLLLVAIVACRLAGLRQDYPYDNLRLALSFIFYTAVSFTTLVLIGRSFLKSGKPGLLLLECGVVLWSLSGTVGDALSHGDRNINATIFDLTILLAGICHLVGAALSRGPQRELRWRGLWLVAGFAFALIALAAITWAALAGRTPIFFIQDQGGTPVRTAVLIPAIAVFLVSAILLRVARRGTVTRFVQWYCFALLLLAVGLFGITIQTSIGCIVNWLARSAQWLGGVYLLVAAMASVRDTGRWEVTLDTEAWDDQFVRFMTPYLLWTLPAAWRYGLAILVVVAATALRWALLPWMGNTSLCNVTLVAILAVAIFLGTGPALLTVVLGDLAVEAFIMRAAQTGFTGENYSRMALSMSIGLLLCWILHTLRAAARKARKSESRLSAFADATFEGICESEGGLVKDCNEQLAQMAGTARSELIGTPISDLVAPEDRERVLANIVENRETVIEHGMLRKDGERITVEAHGSPVAPGSSRRYTAVRDITERKQAEEQVQRSRRVFAELLERSPFGIYVVDSSFRIAHMNSGSQDGAFRNVRPVIGRDFSEAVRTLWPEPVATEIISRFLQTLETGEPYYPPSFTNPRRDLGIVESYEWELHRMMFPDGQYGVICYYFDSTKLRNAELALLEANATLEEKVEERTQELEHRAAQLRALTSELTLAEQRERSRLAKVLHDHLQQVLVAAKFRLTTLSRAGDDFVRQATKEAEGLIDESILASRSLTAELSPPILHVAGLNEGLRWLARRMADRQGLFVNLELNECGPLPDSLKILLFQSVRELLFNVVKHAKTRSAEVNLRCFDGSLQVTVSDQGTGFDPVAMPLAGEGGRGFGLFGIQERLAFMGGTLKVESSPGQGSRFVLSVPITSPTATDLAFEGTSMLPQAHSMASKHADRGLKLRIVVADDHPIVRQGIVSLLANEPDMEVAGQAADGQEAVELAARLLPDVILMDVSMPKLDGVEATRTIHNEFPGICIVGLSMFEDIDRAQAMRDAGAVAYVTKSGPPNAIVNVIRTSALGQRKVSSVEASVSN
jgi:PAS domain S-box-containing protein